MVSDQSRVAFHAGFQLGIEQFSNRRRVFVRNLVPNLHDRQSRSRRRFSRADFRRRFLDCVSSLLEWIFAEITGDRPRQPAYEIKLMLSRVSWALDQISCLSMLIMVL